MSKPDANRDLDALIKATEDNRAELKKTQQKTEALETAVQALQNSKFKTGQKQSKPNPK